MCPKDGYFGNYGGRYVPETLVQPLLDLEEGYHAAQKDPAFTEKLKAILRDFVGRPTSLYLAENLSKKWKSTSRIYLKREDLAHTGAHKINNTMGQVLLAKRMGKKRVVAETGAGQHGVATATAAAYFGMECVVYMGKVDMERQAPNVQRMKLLGSQVVAVTAGTRTLKDAISEAMRDWVAHVKESAYILGSALGPHPYPTMVRDFQVVIGQEAREQILKKEGRLPDELVACVGGGSNSIGLFSAFVNDKAVQMTGVEAGGLGIPSGKHAARFEGGSVGVLQGTKTFILQNSSGQIQETHSISAGLDYAAIGPEHAWLREQGRAKYVSATDEEALKAFHDLSKCEGIIPALESSHALAYVCREAPLKKDPYIYLVNLSGRGDKDLSQVAAST